MGNNTEHFVFLKQISVIYLCAILYAVLEKRIFENFRGPFNDDLINTDESYKWSNEKNIKAKDLKVNIEDILKLVGCKMLTRKLFFIKMVSRVPSECMGVKLLTNS